MKNILFISLVALFCLVSFSGCTLNVPYDMDWNDQEFRVILLVEPEDAHVLLNGKWIGDAYEFSTFESALTLHTRNNEIIIKKDGFKEETVDLYDYSTRKITVRMKLMKDNELVKPDRPVTPPKPGPQPPQKENLANEEEKTEYEAETVPPLEEPGEDEKLTPTNETPVKLYEVKLEIQPEDSSIYLDGRFWGISPKGGKIENLRMTTGKFKLEVIKPGFSSFKKILDIKDKDIKLIIKLEKQEK